MFWIFILFGLIGVVIVTAFADYPQEITKLGWAIVFAISGGIGVFIVPAVSDTTQVKPAPVPVPTLEVTKLPDGCTLNVYYADSKNTRQFTKYVRCPESTTTLELKSCGKNCTREDSTVTQNEKQNQDQGTEKTK